MSPGSRRLTTLQLAVERSARGALALAILCVTLAASQGRGPTSPASPAWDERRFIVAFELRADTRQEFVWPHQSFPGAAYDRVLLAVERMPRVRSSDGRLEALPAANHLRINGRLSEAQTGTGRVPAPDGKPRPEEFVVRLEAGRLRVSLVLPPGVETDPQHWTVRITVYEIGPQPDTSLPTERPAKRN